LDLLHRLGNIFQRKSGNTGKSGDTDSDLVGRDTLPPT
jgi:hypothetical protein